MLLRSMQNTRRSYADAKAENEVLCVMMCRWSSSVAHQTRSVRSVREAATASGVDNAASPTGRHHAERDYFTLRERLITMQKQLEGNQKHINEQLQIELPISMGNSCSVWAIHTRFQRVWCLTNKTEQSIYECLLGSVLITFFCAATNLAASTVFFCPIQKRNDGWWFLLWVPATGLFEWPTSVDTSCNAYPGPAQ